MTNSQRLITCGAVALVAYCIPEPVRAQARPDPDAIVGVLVDPDQRLSREQRRALMFTDACPNQDPWAQQVFTGLQGAVLSEWEAIHLASLWGPVTVRCRDPLLMEWFDGAIRELGSGRYPSASWYQVIASLPPEFYAAEFRAAILGTIPRQDANVQALVTSQLRTHMSLVDRRSMLEAMMKAGTPLSPTYFYAEVTSLVEAEGDPFLNWLAGLLPQVNDDVAMAVAEPIALRVFQGEIVKTPAVHRFREGLLGRVGFDKVIHWMEGPPAQGVGEPGSG